MTHKPRRFDLSPDNFIAGISGELTANELGLYWLICLLIYSHGGPVQYDEAWFSRLLKNTHWRTIRKASERLQELRKITVSDGHVMAKGCARPLQEAVTRISRAIENGSKGGRPSSKINDMKEPNGFNSEKLARVALPPSPPPSPPEELPMSDRLADTDAPATTKDTGKPKKRASYPDAFETFWREYPTDSLMSKKNAFEKWKRLTEDDREAARAAIPAFRRHCQSNPDYRPLHAERFISQRRFDGFNGENGSANGHDAEVEKILLLEEEARKKRMETDHVH